jgi:hypothetical protein
MLWYWEFLKDMCIQHQFARHLAVPSNKYVSSECTYVVTAKGHRRTVSVIKESINTYHTSYHSNQDLQREAWQGPLCMHDNVREPKAEASIRGFARMRARACVYMRVHRHARVCACVGRGSSTSACLRLPLLDCADLSKRTSKDACRSRQTKLNDISRLKRIRQNCKNQPKLHR